MDKDEVLSAFRRYAPRPTHDDIAWWAHAFPQFAAEIRAQALGVINMEALTALAAREADYDPRIVLT